jgi:quinol monooxygenase YgiN
MTMSVLAIAEFFVQPEKAEEFLALLKEVLPDTRAFDGCQSLETYVNEDTAGHVFLVEKWRERSDHEAYLAWRMETGLTDMLAPFVTAPPKFSYFDPKPEI